MLLGHIITQSVIVFLQCFEIIVFIGFFFGTENKGDNSTIIALLSLTGFAGLLFGNFAISLLFLEPPIWMNICSKVYWFLCTVNLIRWPISYQPVSSIQWSFCAVCCGRSKECRLSCEKLHSCSRLRYLRWPFEMFWKKDGPLAIHKCTTDS